MKNFQTEVGEIISVSGNTITVQLSDNIKSNMPVIDGIVYRIGQIGSFLKVPLGYIVPAWRQASNRAHQRPR